MSKEFDDIMRQKFAEKEFTFNEANWEKAEQKMDASIRLKKIIRWSAIFSTGIITGIFVMFFWSNNRTEKTVIAEAEKNIEHVQEQGKKDEETTNEFNSPVSHHSNSDTNPNSANSNRNEMPVNQHTDTQQEITQDSNSSENNPTAGINSNPLLSKHQNKNNKEGISAEKYTTFQSNDAKIKHPQSENESQTASTTATDQKNKNTVTAQYRAEKKKDKTKTKNKIDPAVPEQPEKKDEKSLSSVFEKNTSQSNTGKNNPTDIAVDKTGAFTSKKGGNIDKKAPQKAAANNTTSANTIQEKDSEQSATISDSSSVLTASTSVITDSLNNLLNDSLKIIAVTDSSNTKKDSINKAADQIADLGLDGLATINLFCIDAGANGQAGWSYPNIKEARGITPVLGISILHYFNQKWSAHSGINYSNISYLKTNTINTTVVYSFGSATQTSVLKPSALHYIGIPLYINYHVNEKNAIFAGGNFSYLINNKIKVQNGVTNIVSPNYNQTTANNVSEIRTGFYNKIDLSIAVGYRRKLSSHFSIYPVFYFGLADIKKDALFGVTKFERNSGLKVILSYKIFDF